MPVVCAPLVTRQLHTCVCERVQVEPRQLAATNGRVADVLVGGYDCAASGLRLGDLAGNLFTIVLREVPGGSRATVRAAVAAVRATGFLNYFGLQRFGQGAVPTHAIGAPNFPLSYACMHACHSPLDGCLARVCGCLRSIEGDIMRQLEGRCSDAHTLLAIDLSTADRSMLRAL